MLGSLICNEQQEQNEIGRKFLFYREEKKQRKERTIDLHEIPNAIDFSASSPIIFGFSQAQMNI